MIVNEKRTCRIVDFTVPADPWIKLKESEMNMIVIPIVIDSLGTKDL